MFSVHAKTLPGGDYLALVGFALGAYGLTQAVFQIPYGVASDYLGRKQVIVAGLLIFALGNFVAAWAPDIGDDHSYVLYGCYKCCIRCGICSTFDVYSIPGSSRYRFHHEYDCIVCLPAGAGYCGR